MPSKSRKKDKIAGTAGVLATKPIGERPNWPAFLPLLSPLDLSLDYTFPGQIVCIHNFWTSTLCKTYVSFLSSLPLTTTPGKPKKGDAVRVNDRYQIDDADFAEKLWSHSSLRELVNGDDSELGEHDKRQLWGGDVLGLNPNIRIYRYTKGQFFDQHYDDSNNVTLPGDPPVQAKTTWTLLLYLTAASSGCIGGETVFYPDPPGKAKNYPQPEPIIIDIEVGMALLHKHGKDCMLHEGREVTGGEKWVIRSDLCVKR